MANYGDPEEVERAKTAFAELIEEALSLDGTATGEPGIEIGKRQFMESEHNAPH